MIIPVVILLVALTVPLAGGRLLALADVRPKRTWTLLLALVVQVLVISVAPHWPAAVLAALHVASDLLAGAFVVWNRAIPGLWLVALGGFANPAAVAEPRLLFLGDIFALPAGWPPGERVQRQRPAK